MTQSSQRQLIVKADDYARGMCSLDPWRRFFDVSLDVGALPTVGVVGQMLAHPHNAAASYLRGLQAEYGIEVWNHSLSHRDLRSLSEAEIIAEVTESQRLIELEIGVRPRVFGAPFNHIDERSAAAVVGVGEFEAYYCFEGFVAPTQNIQRKSFLPVEESTQAYRPVRWSLFEAELERKRSPDFLVLQVHPYYWTDECRAVFRRILLTLANKGYQFTDGKSRIRYQELHESGRTPSVGRSLGDNIVWEEFSLSSIETERDAGKVAADSAYYFRMLRAGTSTLSTFLRALGFGALPQVNGKYTILDVGAGIGNWAAAAALLPETHVVALDREERHIKYLRQNSADSRISVEISSLEAYGAPDNSFSGLLCVNALNYMDLLSTLGHAARLVRPSGLLYVGVQNRLYPLRDAADCIRRDDWDRAMAFLRRLVDNEGARCGLVSGNFIRYWNPNELSAVGRGVGMKLQRMGIAQPDNVGEFVGIPTFSGHLYLRTMACARLATDLREGKAGRDTYHALAAVAAPPGRESSSPSRLERLIGVLRNGMTRAFAGNTPEVSAIAANVMRAITERDAAQIREQASHFEHLSDAFQFYASAHAVSLGGAPLVQPSNPVYSSVLNLVHAVHERSRQKSDHALSVLETALKSLDATSLSDWC